jgi:ureidoglycolate lyase
MTQTSSSPLVQAELISSSAFMPYGDIVENKTDQRRRDVPLAFQMHGVKLTPEMWVNRLPRHGLTRALIDVLESHPYSSQTFIPMHASRCMVVVALSDTNGGPDLDTLRAFVTEPGQGVCYRHGVWHYTFLSLDHSNEVAVTLGTTGRNDDTVIVRLPDAIGVNIAVAV